MHDDERETDESLVRRLLAAQFPAWADLPIARIHSAGTDNVIYRLGDDMSVRLPRMHRAASRLDKECEWLPRLAAFLPLAISTLLAKGLPGEGYPWRWSVCRWLDGENATLDRILDPCQAAVALAEFLTALWRIDPTGGPLAVEHDLRGVPLATRDTSTRKAIAGLHDEIDADAATAIWEAALRAPEWKGAPVWFHGDVLPANLLFQRGHLSAVIDFGALGVGDPTCDLMIAWALFAGESRDTFRAALGVDEGMWARGRGHALSQALTFIPYYRNTNPLGVRNARHLAAEVLADRS